MYLGLIDPSEDERAAAWRNRPEEETRAVAALDAALASLTVLPSKQSLTVTRVLALVVMLLPRAKRERWLEEWRGELYDLRADGEPWRRRAGYVSDVVFRTAPSLAVRLRRRPVRVVE